MVKQNATLSANLILIIEVAGGKDNEVGLSRKRSHRYTIVPTLIGIEPTLLQTHSPLNRGYTLSDYIPIVLKAIGRKPSVVAEISTMFLDLLFLDILPAVPGPAVNASRVQDRLLRNAYITWCEVQAEMADPSSGTMTVQVLWP